MSEQTLWEASPSQVTNFVPYLLLSILAPLVLPLLAIVWIYLVTRCTRYELTSHRLRTSHGVLNREVNELELYRVRDYRLEQPFFLRLFGLSTLVLMTSDTTDPVVRLRAIPNGRHVLDQIRSLVEDRRRAIGVRELNIE